MNTEKNWKEPVFVDPARLDVAPDSENRTSPEEKDGYEPSREVPLETVYESMETVKAETPEVDEIGILADRQSRRLRKRFFWSIGLLIALIAGYETYTLVSWGLEQNMIMGGAVAGLICCVLAAGYSLVRHERAGARQLERVAGLQKEAEVLQGGRETGRAVKFVRKIRKQYVGTPLEPVLKRQLKEVDWTKSADGKAMAMVSRSGLKEIDDRAFALVVRRSVEAGVLVSISPIAILDMVLVLWRNTRMLQEIACLYGMKATLTSRFTLFRRVLYNMAFVGVTELVTEIGSDLFGWSLAAKLSARVGQGIGAGLLTGRMGIQAMQLCRPIPFTDGERPRLKEIRSRVLTRLTPEPAGA